MGNCDVRSSKKIKQLVWDMPISREILLYLLLVVVHYRHLLNRSVYKLENLYRINGWRPFVTSATDFIYRFNENHAIVREMPSCTEFSMQFYHQRFPSSALSDRSMYLIQNLVSIK